MKKAIHVYKWLGPGLEKKGFYVYTPGFFFVFPLRNAKKGILITPMGRYEVKKPVLAIDVEELGLEPYVNVNQLECNVISNFCVVKSVNMLDVVLKDSRYPATLFAGATKLTIEVGIGGVAHNILVITTLEPGEHLDFPLRPWRKLYSILTNALRTYSISPESLIMFLELFANLRGCCFCKQNVKSTIECMEEPKPSVANSTYTDLFRDYLVLYRLASIA